MLACGLWGLVSGLLVAAFLRSRMGRVPKEGVHAALSRNRQHGQLPRRLTLALALA